MGSRGLKKDQDRIVIEALAQGFSRRETKNGFYLVPPDKTKPMVLLHETPSDEGVIRVIIQMLKRSGLQWPPPGAKGKAAE